MLILLLVNKAQLLLLLLLLQQQPLLWCRVLVVLCSAPAFLYQGCSGTSCAPRCRVALGAQSLQSPGGIPTASVELIWGALPYPLLLLLLCCACVDCPGHS